MTLACACASAFFTVACALASAFCTVASLRASASSLLCSICFCFSGACTALHPLRLLPEVRVLALLLLQPLPVGPWSLRPQVRGYAPAFPELLFALPSDRSAVPMMLLDDPS